MSEEWISAGEMSAEIQRADVTISASRIERWRNQELLPRPKRIGRGRGRGFDFRVPSGSAAQALEIDRLFKVYEKRPWVGWQLWMQGYSVGERYWRPVIDQAFATLRHFQKLAKQFERRPEDTDVHALKAGVLTLLARTPLAAPLTRADPEMVETIVAFAAEILLARFNRFTPDSRERSTVLDVLGALAGENHSIAGSAIDFRAAIEPVLRDMSNAIRRLLRRKSIIEPSPELRREFAKAFGIGTIIYGLASPLLGRSAMGLGTLNQIAQKPDIGIQSTMLIIWRELRAIQSGPDIILIHDEATKASETAKRFWDVWRGASPNRQARMLAGLREQFRSRKGSKSIKKFSGIAP